MLHPGSCIWWCEAANYVHHDYQQSLHPFTQSPIRISTHYHTQDDDLAGRVSGLDIGGGESFDAGNERNLRESPRDSSKDRPFGRDHGDDQPYDGGGGGGGSGRGLGSGGGSGEYGEGGSRRERGRGYSEDSDREYRRRGYGDDDDEVRSGKDARGLGMGFGAVSFLSAPLKLQLWYGKNDLCRR